MDRSRRLGWLLVAIQFVYLAALTAPWSSWWHLPGGIVVIGWVLRGGGAVLAAVGAVHLGGALTAQPVPKPGAGVVAHGVYRHTRHPIYTGLLLYGAGSVLVTGHPVALAAAVGLLALLMAKARWEESMLIRSTLTYRQYARRTGRFVPWVGRLRS
jgi:protein-S-isoprenylcysteine O-methyltransferase Ste14